MHEKETNVPPTHLQVVQREHTRGGGRQVFMTRRQPSSCAVFVCTCIIVKCHAPVAIPTSTKLLFQICSVQACFHELCVIGSHQKISMAADGCWGIRLRRCSHQATLYHTKNWWGSVCVCVVTQTAVLMCVCVGGGGGRVRHPHGVCHPDCEALWRLSVTLTSMCFLWWWWVLPCCLWPHWMC